MDLSSMDTALYLNIVFLSIVGMATLIGLARGFKKSLISFIFSLGFYLVFFLTLNWVVSFLWTFEIAPLGGWIAMALPGFPTTVTTFEMAIQEAIQLFVSPSVPLDFSNPQLMNLVSGVGQFAIKLVWFILYFTIGVLVFGLVRLIINSLFIKNTKMSRKYGTKNPLLGGLFGFLQGAVAVYITLIMFGGLMSVAESLIVLIPEEGFEPDPISVEIDRNPLYQLNQPILPLANPLPIPGLEGFGDIDEMVQFLKDFVQAYNENPIVSTIATITIVDPSDETEQMPLNLYLFDEVLSFEFREQPIALRKELNVVAEIAGVALASEYIETSNLGDLTGDEVRQVFSILSRSDLISSLIPLAIEVAIDYTDLPVDLSTEELYGIPWKAELANLGNIAALIFDIAETAGVFEGGFEFDEIPVTKDDAIQLFDSLADSQLITYATAVALPPLMEMVGEPVSLILTVPADLVWADEFRSIGAIVGELLELDITMTMINSGDYVGILGLLSDFDFTMFLESELITNALVNLLSGNIPLPGLELLIVPAGLDIRAELVSILTAMTQVVGIASQLDFNNLQIGDISLLTDDAIDAIFESKILIATLTNQLLTIDLSGLPIVLPDLIFDEDDYLKKSELVALTQSLRLVASKLACDEGDTECQATGFDLMKLTSLSEDDFETLLESEILSASVGSLILEQGGEFVIAPPQTLSDLLVRESLDPVITNTIEVVQKDEILKLLTVITKIDLSDINFEEFTFGPELLDLIKDPEDATKLNSELADALFDSLILHATLSDLLINTISEMTDMIVIPYFDALGNEVRYLDQTIEYIAEEELITLFEAFFALNITDFENIQFDITMITDNIDTLLSSAILHATVSKVLFDLVLQTDLIVVPYFDVDGEPIRLTVGSDEQATTYLVRSEIEAAVDALGVFGITDFESIGEDFDFSPIFAEGNIAILLQSAIIHATVSKQLFDLNIDLLEIPYFDVDNNPIRTTVGVEVEEQTTYLNQSELDALIEALDVFGINDLDSITEEFDFSPIFAEGNIAILLQSAIIHATVSKQLFDLNIDLLEIPYFDVDSNPIRTTAGVEVEEQTNYLNQSELEALIDALDVFGINDLDSITEEFDFSPIFAEGNITILLQSAIIHATVSKQLFELNVDLLEIPYFDVDNNPIRTTVGVEVEEQTTYLNQSELEALIEALDVFGINDLDSITEEFDFSPIFGEGNMAILLESAIIHATVSKQLFEMNVELLEIPYFDVDNNPIRTTVGALTETTTYLNESELISLIDALDVFGINDLDSITEEFDFSPIFGEGNMTILLESAIIHATVSKQLFEMNVELLEIPYFDVDNNPIRTTVGALTETTTYLNESELISLIDALDVFGINDLDSITEEFDFSPIFGEGNMAILLESAIIHATVSKQLFDLNVDMLVIPYYDVDADSIRVNRGVGEELTTYLTKTELVSLIDALDVFGINDLDSITDEFDFSPIFTDGNMSILLESAIIHATVSKQLFDLNVDMLVIPYYDVEDDPVRMSQGLGLEETTYITKTELESLIDSLDLFGINDLDSITDEFDFSPIFVEGNMALLLESAIMHATVSKQLFDLNVDMLVIPHYDVDEEPIRIRRGLALEETTYLTKEELVSLIDSLDLFGINDLDSITDEFDFSPIFVEGNMALLLESAIMHATVSKQIFDLPVDSITVPHFDDLDQPIRLTVGQNLADQSTYLLKSELIALIEALDLFGIDDIDNIDANLDFGPVFEDGNMAIMLESKIIHATIAKQILDLGEDNTIEIPTYDSSNQVVLLEVGDALALTNTTYIVSDELVALVDALDMLELTDFETFNGSIDLSKLSAEGNMAILLDSAILHATVSKQLLDLSEDETLQVPYFDETSTSIRIEAGSSLDFTDTTYLIKTEIEALIDALDVLQITDIDSFTGTIDLSLLAQEGATSRLLASAIIHATVSDQLFDLGSNGTINVPHYDETETAIRLTVGTVGNQTDTDYLKKTELTALIDSLNILNITDIDSFTGSVDLSILSEEGKMAAILQSAILHATVSEQLYDLSEDDTILLPYFDSSETPLRINVGEVLDQADTAYLLKTELIALVDALDVLNIGDLESFTGSIDLSLLSQEGAMARLLASAVIHATISEQLFDLSLDGTIEVPYFQEDNSDLRIVVGVALEGTETIYLIKAELESLIDSLNVLDVSDVENFSGSVDLSLLSDQTNRDTVLSSSIIQATISKQLIDLKTDGTINVPYFDEGEAEIIKAVGVVLENTNTTYIVKAELDSLFSALDVLNITDVENFDGNIDLSLLSDSETADTVLSSAIIHATVSEQIIDLDTNNTITLPHFDSANVALRIHVGVALDNTDTQYVLKAELKAMFDALEVLNITDVEEFGGSVDLSLLSDSQTADTVLASAIIHATVSEQIIDLNSNQTITLPHYDSSEAALRINVGVVLDGTNTEYVLKTELKALFDALDVLGITDVEAFSGSVNLSLLSDSETADTVLASAIIHATVSEQIIDLDTNNTITLPHFDATDTALRIHVGVVLDGTNTEYVLKTELKALFDALEVLNITDVEAFGGTVDLSLLSDSQTADTVLSSAIIHATVSEQIIDLDTNNTITLPHFDSLDSALRVHVGVVLDGTDTEYVVKAELKALFDALDVLGISDVEQFDGSVDLSLLSDSETADTVLASAVIHATVSEQIIDLDGNNTITLPHFDSTSTALRVHVGVVLDSTDTEYVVKAELKALFDALDVLGISDVESFNGTVNLSLLSDHATANKVLSSAVIHSTISTQLLDLAGDDTLSIPHFNIDLDELRIQVGVVLDSTDTTYLLKEELVALFDALDVLGINDVESFTGNVNLSLLSDQVKRDTVLSSAIIHGTISTQLADLDDANTISLPYRNALDTVNIVVQTGDSLQSTDFDYVSKDELKELFEALDFLGITDVTAFNGDLDLTMFYTTGNRQILLDSAIMHATISKQLLDLGPAALSVPHQDETSSTIRVTTGIGGNDTEFIVASEVEAIFEALEKLGIDDIQEFGGDINLSLFYEEADRDILLASASMHATMSKQILDLNDDALDVPTHDVSNTAVRVTVGPLGKTTEFITKTEVHALFEALEILGIQDISTFDGAVDLSDFFEEPNQNILLTSASMHKTMTNQILDLDSAVLLVPSQDVNSVDIQVTVSTNLYIIKDEIKAIFNALELLNITSISGFTGSISLTNLYSDGNQNILLTSASMHATVSKQILDLSPATLLVPSVDVTNTAISSVVNTVTFLTKTEIKAIINGLELLGVSDITDFDGTFTFTNLQTTQQQDTLLSSASMHATISRTLFDLDDSVLIVPSHKQDTTTVLRLTQDTTEFVIKDEIKAILNAFISMGYTNLDGFGAGIDSAKFFDDTETILLSSSIQATLSNQILNQTGGAVIVPNEDINSNDIRISVGSVVYVDKDELIAMMNALDLLGLTDFDNISITPTLLFAQDMNVILESVSMQTTISKSILDQASDESGSAGSLIVPNYFRETLPFGLTTTTQIEKAELIALLDSLESLGITNFSDAISPSAITSMNDAQLDILLGSGSMHTTIDYMIQDNANITVPDKAQVDLYDLTDITTKAEVKAFIKAANAFGATDFSTVSFSLNAILALDANQRDITLSSMIVRNKVTPDIVTAVNVKNAQIFPTPPYVIDNTDYEDSDPLTFMTKQGILDALVFLES